MLEDAAFLSGLRKIETYDNNQLQEPWKAKYVLHYIQDRFLQPDFVVDISHVIEQKLESIKAFATQFYKPGQEEDEPQTYISTPDFLESVIYRSKMLGKMIGVAHAEGFISKKMIGISRLDSLVANVT